MENTSTASPEWTDAELGAAVDAYFEMLTCELAGSPYSKADVRRRYLAKALAGRTVQSFEFRMRNISAVMESMGLRRIAGYAPARRVGRGVQERLESTILTRPESHHALSKPSGHVARREEVLDALVAELFGPNPTGEELDCSGEVKFDDVKASYRPRRQAGSGEEILLRDRPSKRYGIGVLSPLAVPLDEATETIQQPLGSEETTSEAREADGGEDALSKAGADRLQASADRLAAMGTGSGVDDYDFDLGTVNAYQPSSMAVTFLAHLPVASRLLVRVSGGRYDPKLIKTPSGDRTWWLRTSVHVDAVFSAETLFRHVGGRCTPDEQSPESTAPLALEIVAYPRAQKSEDTSLVTLCLVNRSSVEDLLDRYCLFQSQFTAEVESLDGGAHILPYPEPEGRPRDDEERSLALLYRRSRTFAVGHGVAADWAGGDADTARAVSADPFPVFEVPNVSADVRDRDGRKLEVSMAALAGLQPADDGMGAVEALLAAYEIWIRDRWKELRGEGDKGPFPSEHSDAANRHLILAEDACRRMRDGIAFLAENSAALSAFRMANEAVLLQQLRTRGEPRRLRYDNSSRQITFDEAPATPDPLDPPQGRGHWRGFQIAFLLSCLRSVATYDDDRRDDVELIWFPTGGGKTEAYLALTAFSLFYRRLRDRTDAGVDVLMRYTLRLLTAQQFQRASALICAMESIRRGRTGKLGHAEFSIGLWLGGSVSPNSRADAKAALRAMQRGDDENRFVLTKCPWCAGQLGQFKYTPRGRSATTTVVGYAEQDGTVMLRCSDARCAFSDRLPIYVTDEDVYEQRPSLVIATVDKFARLAWEPRARALFGIGEDGARVCSPPNLIIQDELHLISGPLGSMVGAFEGVVDALCRSHSSAKPKIVSSTATIRRFEDQIHDLYSRTHVNLFPPQGLDAGDSFFARSATDRAGNPLPGRKFVGVHAPGLGSIQTAQVRTFSALLQAPATFSDVEKDPWWTLMVFFNSLRELGTTVSLLQSDIPDYLWAIRQRLGLAAADSRRLRDFLELTGRLKNDEVPRAMERLEVETTSAGATAVDACLASNIIEVGIDIDRLSLMCVVGQPKTTSQYIQVTGRVGRKWWERPALVATIYGASKPRDRSHFEKFRSYHERLYAQVEPTSVTPFSPPVVDRSLHALLAAWVRQSGSEAEANSPYPVPLERIEAVRAILERRVNEVDPEEGDRFRAVFDMRVQEWDQWQRTTWRRKGRDEEIPLLRPAGDYATAEEAELSWPTPNSLRDVDAECVTSITTLYLRKPGE